MIKKSKVFLLCMIVFIIIFNSNCFIYAQKDIALPSGLSQSDIQPAIEAYIKEHKDTTAGVTISIFNDQDTLYREHYGYADIENQVSINEDTVFEWGSSTKLLVWVSVLQLWEQGQIDLDEDIRTYLPKNFLTKSNYDGKITMFNLMHHDAGWQDVVVDLFVKDIQDVQGLKETLQKTEPEQIYSAGKIKGYSNWGAALAAYIVEEITGQKFYEYIHDNIFIPLNMEHTALLPDLSDNLWVKERRQEIQGYTYENKIIKKNFYYIPLYPAGMATSTIEDFEKFGKSLIDDSESQKLFQNKDTLHQLLKPTLYYGDMEHARNCNGFWVMEWGVPTLGHGGNTEAFSSNLLIDVVSKTGVVVMTNQRYEETYNYKMMPLIFGEFHPSSSTGFLPKQEGLSGTYQNARTISKGYGKLYSFITRMKIEDAGNNELKVIWPGKSYTAYQFAPSLYDLDGSLFYVDNHEDGSIILSEPYGDYYKIDQAQITIEYIVIGSAMFALCYFIIMLIIESVAFIQSKKKKQSFLKDPLEKYHLFILFIIFFVFLNIFIMVLKLLNYSVLGSIRPHIYLSFVFMIIPLVYTVFLPFALRKINIMRKTKIKYILTGIAGCIVSFNIYYWQMYLLK